VRAVDEIADVEGAGAEEDVREEDAED
jgi:hypothetical protein